MNINQTAQAILDILFEDDGEGLTKYEIAVLLDIDAAKVKSAMNEARVLAEELGMFIPTPLADDGFKFRLTDNGDVIWASQLFHERQRDGIDRVTKKHADAVRDRTDDLEVEDRVMVQKLHEFDEMSERHRSEVRSKMVQLAVDMRRQRRMDSDEQDAS